MTHCQSTRGSLGYSNGLVVVCYPLVVETWNGGERIHDQRSAHLSRYAAAVTGFVVSRCLGRLLTHGLNVDVKVSIVNIFKKLITIIHDFTILYFNL